MSLSLIFCGNTQRNTVSIGGGAISEHCGMAKYMIEFDRDPITFGCEGQVRDGLPAELFSSSTSFPKHIQRVF